MAGPKYNVGIRFKVEGGIAQTLSALDKRLKSMAVNAEKVGAALSRSVIQAAKRAGDKTVVQSHRTQQAIQRINSKTAAMAEKETISVQKARAEADAKAQASTIRLASLKSAADDAEETRQRRRERREEAARKRRVRSISRDAKQIAQLGGLAMGGPLGTLMGMVNNPVVLGLGAAAFALKTAHDWALKYNDSLVLLSRTGLSFAESQKAFASLGGMHAKYMNLSQVASADVLVRSMLPAASTSQQAEMVRLFDSVKMYLQAGGVKSDDAMAQAGGIVEAAIRGAENRGAYGAGGITSKASKYLGMAMSRASTLGVYGSGYLGSVTQLFQNMGGMSNIQNMGNAMNLAAILAQGGASPEVLSSFIMKLGVGVKGGPLVAGLLEGGQSWKMQGLAAAIQGRPFEGRNITDEMSRDPSGFLKDVFKFDLRRYAGERGGARRADLSSLESGVPAEFKPVVEAYVRAAAAGYSVLPNPRWADQSHNLRAFDQQIAVKAANATITIGQASFGGALDTEKAIVGIANASPHLSAARPGETPISHDLRDAVHMLMDFLHAHMPAGKGVAARGGTGPHYSLQRATNGAGSNTSHALTTSYGR